MRVARSVVAALLCLVLQSNEAVAIGRLGMVTGSMEKTSVSQGAQLALRALAAVEANAKETITRSMTTEKAFKFIANLKGTPTQLKVLLQTPGYAGVQKGQDMLNDMIKETTEKLDMEREACYQFIATQEHLVSVAEQDIRMFDGRAAAAREGLLAAQTEIERLTELLPQLQETLEAHNRKCVEDIDNLEAQLKIVLGDIGVMTSVLKLTECGTSLVQRVVLRSAAAKVTSAKARRLLQEGMDEACGDDMPLETPDSPEAFVQLSANPTKVVPIKQRAKCTLSKKSCKRLRDKFLEIQSGIQAKRDELLAELQSLRKHCADERSNLESQISDAETDLKSQQTALAGSTKELNDAERNSKLKNEEKLGLRTELERMRKLCEVNIENYISEKCALGKIRGELEQMKGHTNPAFLQDCEVTDWSASSCSVACGGGSQTLTRAVSVHPVGGAACPPLQMQRACNEEACPIDCELGDWTEWSDCSAECNGGVKEKIRSVLVVPQFSGTPCGETSVAESCNIQSCDKDCVLSDWGAWSACSKECNVGLLSREKALVVAAVGQGKCSSHTDSERLELHPCNEQSCKGNVTCESKLDVVLLLDGSGSLGSEGWAKTKEAGVRFVRALHGGDDRVKASVILFGGPRTWSKYYMCTGASQGTPDMKNDCGIDIVKHFTTDMDSLAGLIEKLEWPASTTLTSAALMLAKTELSLGRKDANSVVIVVTDGRPLNKARTAEVSREIREVARLMWVPVSNNVPMRDIKSWASKPVSENVIKIDGFEALSDPETITGIIADMCPSITSSQQ